MKISSPEKLLMTVNASNYYVIGQLYTGSHLPALFFCPGLFLCLASCGLRNIGLQAKFLCTRGVWIMLALK